jgi:hypothetical protein
MLLHNFGDALSLLHEKKTLKRISEEHTKTLETPR